MSAAGRPAEERAKPRVQLLERERLHEVVVGARVEPRHAVADGVARGQHQHGRVVVGGAEPAADLQPVEVRHQHVQHHGVGRVKRQAVERLGAVGRELDVVALQPEGPLERRADGRLVVDDENTHGESVPAEPV